MQTIPLIADSGIQFYEIGLNLADTAPVVKSTQFEYAEQPDPANERVNMVFPYLHQGLNKNISRIDINPDAIDENGRVDESKIRPANRVAIDENDMVFLKAQAALELYENVWLPLPYFKVEFFNRDVIQQGPQTWARMYLGRLSPQDKGRAEGLTHKLVLAFDTRCYGPRSYADVDTDEGVNHTYYLAPTHRDAQGGQTRFVCATQERFNSYWLSRSWVDQWLKSEYQRDAMQERRQKIEISVAQREPVFAHLGFYLLLLDVLRKADAFPNVTLHTDANPLDVNLILDTGNSRTCGLILESGSDRKAAELSITDASRLRIRELEDPTRSSDEPFDMRLAFTQVQFGRDGMRTGNPNAFAWPSLVRVGKEATRYSVIFGKNGTEDGKYERVFSSPKRYLWDTRRSAKPWAYYTARPDAFQQTANYLKGAELFSDEGKLVSRAERTGEAYSYMGNPFYSRGSLMTFALMEIFLQTLSYVNSVEYRRKMQDSTLPRRLRRIVLTCPTAMLKEEKARLRAHAADALQALREHLGNDLIPLDLEIIPDEADVRRPEPDGITEVRTLDDLQNFNNAQLKKTWGYDEATCSQLTYLYNEVVQRFGKTNAELYFNTMGRMRQDSIYASRPEPRVKSVTVASVDIGGGTTDLMICNYELSPDRRNPPELIPNPLFWEGFNMAGDQIARRLLERLVLPQLYEQARQQGANRPFLYRTFGPYYNEEGEMNRTLKKLFANQVGLPLAYGFLNAACERDETARTLSFLDFFVQHEAPGNQVVEYVNQAIQQAGGTGFDLRRALWTVDSAQVNAVIRQLLEPMLRDLSGILAQYDCDVVLLSGRPSTLPVVQDIFLENLPVTPDRLVPMGSLRVRTSRESWYPFADAGNHTIKDPKTCVTVGASLALLANLRMLNGFVLDTRLLANKVISTADYVGVLTNHASPPMVRESADMITPDETRMEFDFGGGNDSFLGMRQLATEKWQASAMYKIDFVSADARQQFGNRLPFRVVATRRNRWNKEEIVLQSIRDHSNRPLGDYTDPQTGRAVSPLTMSLCSLTDEHGYWLDTGIFNVDLEK